LHLYFVFRPNILLASLGDQSVADFQAGGRDLVTALSGVKPLPPPS
jgi:hypothetical protein